MRVFEYCVFLTEYNDKDEEVVTMLTPITAVVEKDQKIVEMKAVRGLDEKYMDKLDKITIAVRPF